MIRQIATAVMVVFTASPFVANAQIYDNGAPNAVDGTGIAGSVLADNFTIGNNFSVSNIRFWGHSTLNRNTYSGSVAWAVYANGAGQPGSVLFSGSASPVGVNQGPLSANGADRYQFDFGANFSLAAGTYWLSLYTGAGPVAGNFYWDTADEKGNGHGWSDVPNDPGHWSEASYDYAFQLYGQTENTNVVPEPGTYALLATGLLGIGVMRRRRRA